ncbi:uncharacterized protein LOC8271689 isoform X2 [Ricinus communis]|uniref:uncharacterized protein LOC8271689 isoform X2 n=1 Tax=Ricinus communis TaxID=3988 RepID=UPI000D68DAFA|nr:uncharacterized protein LOC8271689 isoform X2 [Ricinus communis]|eukprot:XP_025015329.1 uncharacterized protein LOC8271689 isoform X2 [Ricinus communis]
MESRIVEDRNPELEESFSFSSYDFNSSSSFVFFSDNEDIDDNSDDDGGGGRDSYIEIALEPANIHQKNKYDNDEEEAMELRISFSSSIPLPDQETNTAELCESVASSASSSSSSFTFTSSFTESQRNTEAESKQPSDCTKQEKTIKSKVHKTFSSSFRIYSPEIDVGDSSADTARLNLVPASRKNVPKIATTTMSSTGMLMNFFVKLRVSKLKTLLASFLKASQTNSGRHKGKKPEETFRTNYRNLINPIDKGSAAAERKQGNGEKSRMLELNLDAIKEYVLEAMSITSLGRRDRRTKSCPVSTKSSPIHLRSMSESNKMSATENSIQAAIAHCKRSLGPNI